MRQERTGLQNFYSKFNLLQERAKKFRYNLSEQSAKERNDCLDKLRISTDNLVDYLVQQNLEISDKAQEDIIECVAELGSGSSLQKLADKFGKQKLFDFITSGDFRSNPLSRALATDNLDAVKWFLNADKDVAKSPVLYYKGKPSYAIPFTLNLNDTCRNFKYDADKTISVMQELLKSGADINAFGSWGNLDSSALDRALCLVTDIVVRKDMSNGFDSKKTCPTRGVTVGMAGIERSSHLFDLLEVKLDRYALYDLKIAKFLLANGAKNVGNAPEDVLSFVRDLDFDNIPTVKELAAKYPSFISLAASDVVRNEVLMLTQTRRAEDHYPRQADQENGSNKWAHLLRKDSLSIHPPQR